MERVMATGDRRIRCQFPRLL